MTVLTAVMNDDQADAIIEAGDNLASKLGIAHTILHVADSNAVEEHALQEIDKRIPDHVVDYSLDFAQGNPAEEILRIADDRQPAYVVIGGRKRTPVGKAVFGSVTQSVLLNSPCPVLVVTGDRYQSIDGPILAAVDDSDRSALVVREAEALANAHNSDIVVLHVIPTKEWLELHRDRIEATTTEGVDKDKVEARAIGIAKQIGDQHLSSYTPVGMVNEPSKGILEHASAIDASYIVLAGRNRTPVGKVLFGSVTQSVLLGADRPTLVVIE